MAARPTPPPCWGTKILSYSAERAMEVPADATQRFAAALPGGTVPWFRRAIDTESTVNFGCNAFPIVFETGRLAGNVANCLVTLCNHPVRVADYVVKHADKEGTEWSTLEGTVNVRTNFHIYFNADALAWVVRVIRQTGIKDMFLQVHIPVRYDGTEIVEDSWQLSVGMLAAGITGAFASGIAPSEAGVDLRPWMLSHLQEKMKAVADDSNSTKPLFVIDRQLAREDLQYAQSITNVMLSGVIKPGKAIAAGDLFSVCAAFSVVTGNLAKNIALRIGDKAAKANAERADKYVLATSIQDPYFAPLIEGLSGNPLQLSRQVVEQTTGYLLNNLQTIRDNAGTAQNFMLNIKTMLDEVKPAFIARHGSEASELNAYYYWNKHLCKYAQGIVDPPVADFIAKLNEMLAPHKLAKPNAFSMKSSAADYFTMTSGQASTHPKYKPTAKPSVVRNRANMVRPRNIAEEPEMEVTATPARVRRRVEPEYVEVSSSDEATRQPLIQRRGPPPATAAQFLQEASRPDI